MSEDMTTAVFLADSGFMGDGNNAVQVYAATLP
jgi:hypothetical protein